MATTRYVWEKWDKQSNTNYYRDDKIIKLSNYNAINKLYDTGVPESSITKHKLFYRAITPPTVSGSTFDLSGYSDGFVSQSNSPVITAGAKNAFGIYPGIAASTTSNGTVGFYMQFSDDSGASGLFWYSVAENVYYTKGSTLYGSMSSGTSNSFPENGEKGDYWYVSKGSDNIDPVSLTYTDAVKAGENVTLTITPSTGTTLGGNISYVIQTTVNGTDWYDAGETSGTSYTVTVPADAIVWNVRVYAKDDTGFTSSTYIYGNGVDTYVNVIRVGISPDSGDIGYITSPQVMFVSVNTDTDYTFTVKLDGETLSSSSSSSSTIQHIILSEEKFNSLKEETKYTLTVEIVQNSATITRTYTFQKFVYDDTTLGGVMEGAGKALRIKRKIQSQIVGANIPKEIIKIDNPIGVSDLAAATASEAQVFKGYTFFSGDNELKTGIALGTATTISADKLLSGITAYNNLGQLITGTLANPYQLYVDTRSTSISFTRHHDDDDYYSNVYWSGSSTIYLPRSNATYVMAHITVEAGYSSLYSGRNVLSKVNGDWVASVNAGLQCYGSGNYINIGGNATYGQDPQGANATVVFYSFVKVE